MNNYFQSTKTKWSGSQIFIWIAHWCCNFILLHVNKFHKMVHDIKLLKCRIEYRLDIYELLNRTSSRIIRVAAASGVVQEFRIVISPKVKIKNSTSSVYSTLYGSQSNFDLDSADIIKLGQHILLFFSQISPLPLNLIKKWGIEVAFMK